MSGETAKQGKPRDLIKCPVCGHVWHSSRRVAVDGRPGTLRHCRECGEEWAEIAESVKVRI